MMEEFDAVAEDINTKVDAFAEAADSEIEKVMVSLSVSMVRSIVVMGTLVVVTLLLGAYIRKRIINQVVKPLLGIEEAAKEMAAGSLQTKITYTSSDEIGQLAVSLQNAMDTWNTYILEIKRCMQEMQEGNLKVHSNVRFEGDFVELQESILQFTQSLNHTMTEINQSAERVSSDRTGTRRSKNC